MSHVPDETAYRNVTIEHGRARLAELDLRWGRRQAVRAHWLDAEPDADLRAVIAPEAEGGDYDYNDGLLQRASHALVAARINSLCGCSSAATTAAPSSWTRTAISATAWATSRSDRSRTCRCTPPTRTAALGRLTAGRR
ncbi:hypothetical protein ACIO3O_00040 [Streptomyces sp. NPDC087440]|uniref:hypothetical protein n=1 Tax=Streptomyces sp. NPDC087440 TaxID=3365790 RepID=UPI00382AD0BC